MPNILPANASADDIMRLLPDLGDPRAWEYACEVCTCEMLDGVRNGVNMLGVCSQHPDEDACDPDTCELNDFHIEFRSGAECDICGERQAMFADGWAVWESAPLTNDDDDN